MRFFRWVLFGFALALLAACGGGGGGGVSSAGAALIYSTDWSWAGAPGGGAFQLLSVADDSGKILRTVSIARGASNVSTVRIEALPAGEVLVRVELSAQSGTAVTGLLQVPLTLSGEVQLKTEVGAPAAGVNLFPPSASIAIPRVQRFYAAARTSSGSLTFSAPGAVSWQVVGGIGSVSADGLFTPNVTGLGSVRASLGVPPLTGSAPVQVSPSTTQQGKWTVLVYMSAASDLHPFSDLNFDQIERASTNPDVRFVVQWKQARSIFPSSSFDGTRRYVTKYDAGTGVRSDLVQDLGSGIDMGKPETLREFIQWAKTYYPAQRYCLVVWSHGNGWRRRPEGPSTRAVSYDDETGSAIQIWSLGTALAGQHVDLLAWDASLMQMVEVAYEVRQSADFVIGSEESPPGEGYPYDGVFARFAQRPDDPPRNLARAFVDATLAVPGYANRKITQSVVETSKLQPLGQSINALAVQLMGNRNKYESAYRDARSAAQSYSPTGSRYYRDLSDFCAKLAAASDLDPWCNDVIAKLTDAVIWEGHSSLSPGSHGLSLDFTPGITFMPNAADYGRMQFAKDTLWDDWLVTAP